MMLERMVAPGPARGHAIALAALLASAVPVTGGGPALCVSVSPARPLIGDHVEVTLSVEPAAAAASMHTTPDLASALAAGLGRAHVRVLGAVSGDAPSPLSASALLMPLSTGTLALGPFSVGVLEGAGPTSPVTLTARAIVLEIPSLLATTVTEPAEIKPPVPYHPDAWPLVTVAAGGLAAFILLGMAIWRMLRRPPSPPPPPIPPEIEARRAIEVLMAEGLIAAGQIGHFVDRLSDILRRYVGRRYALPAMAETTLELTRALAVHPAARDETVRRIETFLDGADLVKFAPVRPALATVHAMPTEALAIVDTTTSAPPPAARPGASAS